MIHEHHHHHHHKNVSKSSSKKNDYDTPQELSTDTPAYKLKMKEGKSNFDMIGLLFELLTQKTDEQDMIERSAVYSQKQDTKDYRRIAEIYRDLYADYYTAYIQKAGYESHHDSERNDEIDSFIQDGYQPIVEIELDL